MFGLNDRNSTMAGVAFAGAVTLARAQQARGISAVDKQRRIFEEQKLVRESMKNQ